MFSTDCDVIYVTVISPTGLLLFPNLKLRIDDIGLRRTMKCFLMNRKAGDYCRLKSCVNETLIDL